MKRRTQIAIAGCLMAAATLMMAQPAGAQPGTDKGTDAVEPHRVAQTKAEQKRIQDYWTADKMLAAESAEARPDADTQTSTVTKGDPTVVKGARKKKPPVPAEEGTPYLGGPWTGAGSVVSTTGKVFFTLGGTDYVCSGSVVPATNKSTVSTAGHCTNEGPGDYATNFIFVPAYDAGAAPYGEWVATTLATTDEWKNSGDFNYDVAFAEVAPLDGAYLSDEVGSQTIGFNQPRGEFLYSFGYPAASPYDGTTLDYCSDTASDDTIGGTDDLRIACNMTGGSSGGPWFDDFSEATGTGIQVSVNSFGYRGEQNAMYGPYFGEVIQSLYEVVEA